MKDPLKLYYFLGYIPGLFAIVPFFTAFTIQTVFHIGACAFWPFAMAALFLFFAGGIVNFFSFVWRIWSWEVYVRGATPLQLKIRKSAVVFSILVFSAQILLLLIIMASKA